MITDSEIVVVVLIVISLWLVLRGRSRGPRRPIPDLKNRVSVQTPVPVVVAPSQPMVQLVRPWKEVPFPLPYSPDLALYVVEPKTYPEFLRAHTEGPMQYRHLARVWGTQHYFHDAALVIQKGHELQREHPMCFILCANTEQRPQPRRRSS